MQPAPHLTVIDMSDGPTLTGAVRAAFDDALAGRGHMDEAVYAVGGFCGRKHRLFINNLVARTDVPRYLEIGVFHGATLCAAISNNKVRVTGIDNWTEYGGRANEFYANLAKIKGPEAAVSIVEQDFRAVDYSTLGPFSIGFYDGPHAERDQYDGAIAIIGALERPGVLLVDDWNWGRVRNGTLNAIRDTCAQIKFAIELRTSFDDQIPAFAVLA